MHGNDDDALVMELGGKGRHEPVHGGLGAGVGIADHVIVDVGGYLAGERHDLLVPPGKHVGQEGLDDPKGPHGHHV